MFFPNHLESAYFLAHSLIIIDPFQSISHILSHSLLLANFAYGIVWVLLVEDVDDDDGFIKAPRALHQGYDANEARSNRYHT